MKTEVLQFNNLISFHDGRFVKEKIYHTKHGNLTLCCGMWCAWLENKNRWSKWHIRYYFENEQKQKLYTDFNEFIMLAESRILSITK